MNIVRIANPPQPTDTKKPLVMSGLSVGWDGWVRTIEMPESKSGALPLGYIPICDCLSIVSQKI